MQRQDSTSWNSSATSFPSSLTSAKGRRQQETFLQETFVSSKGNIDSSVVSLSSYGQQPLTNIHQ